MLGSQLAWVRWFGVSPPKAESDPTADVWMYTHEQIHGKAMAVIRRIGAPTFGFFHYGLPHYPYVWSRGGRRGVRPEHVMDHTVSNCTENLRYLDTVIGEIADELKRAGKFDPSLLVFTSDHTWRWDPALESSVSVPIDNAAREMEVEAQVEHVLKHVPLIIKMPNQKAREEVNDTIQLSDLFPLFKSTLAEARGDERAHLGGGN